jgi:TorA maturation chaperone TorD
MLLYPDEERLKRATTAATLLQEQNSILVRFAFFPQWQRLFTVLTALPDHRTLEEEYVQVFLHHPERAPCPPYESMYVNPGGQAAGWVIVSVEREYAAAGLTLSPFLKELPDHAAVELEFMSFLCSQEADAWSRKAVNKGIQALERQAAFLEQHLIRWFPVWAKGVAAIGGEGIYTVVAETARAFLSHDQDLINLLLERLRPIPEMSPAQKSRKRSQNP